jgi:lactoylglutathione lyase
MELAKQQVDIGLFTNDLDRMLPFWQNEVGLRFDHVLPLRRGQKQYRHDAAGSVVKINHHIEPIPSAPPSGYRELIVAQTSRSARLTMADPDGNAVSVVPPGYHGVWQIGIRLRVRDLEAHRHFYADIVGLQEQAYPLGAAFSAGDTVIFLEQEPGVVVDAGVHGLGWRYITFQVFKVDEVHARMIAAGVREASAPKTIERQRGSPWCSIPTEIGSSCRSVHRLSAPSRERIKSSRFDTDFSASVFDGFLSSLHEASLAKTAGP